MFLSLSQWIANPLNDMYADAVTTVVLEVQSNPKAQRGGFSLTQCVELSWRLTFSILFLYDCHYITFLCELMRGLMLMCGVGLVPVMESQCVIVDMEVYQARLEVMLQ